MPSSVRDFWATLVRLGLIDPTTAESLAARTVGGTTGPGGDLVGIAKFLIQEQVLTRFQVKRVLADRGDELVQGDYRVIDRVQSSPLSRWYRARHGVTGADVLVFPCGSAADSPHPVDPAWLASHAALAADGLQPIEVVTLANADAPPLLSPPAFGASAFGASAFGASGATWRGLVVSPLPDGRTLADWIAVTGALGWESALPLGQAVGGAVAAMHRASLFHGGIRPGRVWIASDASVYLLRSAGGPPIFPGETAPVAYDWFDDDGQAAAFASPQWLAGQTHADALSDVYSLGALLYHTATGNRVATGVLPDEIAQAVAGGPAGVPLLRVIGAALAADPSARFPDVASFLRALGAAETISPVATEPSTGSESKAADVAMPAVPDVGRRESDQAATRSAPVQPSGTSGVAKPVSKSEPGPKAESKPKADTRPAVETQRAVETVSKASIPDVIPVAATTPEQVATRSAGPETAAGQAVPLVRRSPGSIAPQAAAAKPAAVRPSAAKPAQEKTAAEAAAAEKPKRVRKRTKRNRRGPILIGSSAVAILLLLVAILLRPGDEAPPPKPRPTPRPTAPQVAQTTAPSTSSASPSSTAPASTTGQSGYELVSDQRVLWAPPWPADSAAPPLDLVVPGAQAIVSVRPRSMLQNRSGADWVGWFGQEISPSLEMLAKRAGVAADQIDRVVIGLVPGVDGVPDATLAVWLAEPTELKSLRSKWGVTASRTPDGVTLFTGDEPDSDAYFVAGESVTDSTLVSSFAVGKLALVRTIAEGGGGPILMPPPLRSAWDQTSAQADLTAMVIPNFLFADGRSLLQRFAPRAIDPLKRLLIPEVSAVVITIDTQEHWYGELRLVPGGGATPPGLAKTVQDRVAELPGNAETFAIESNVDPSWRALAIRLPQYLRAIQDQIRFGVSGNLPTANFYLPAAAAPQVTLASLLALSTTPQSPVAAVAAPPPAGPMSIGQMLETKMSISFEQESLEFAVSMIGDEFVGALGEGATRPKITIIGGDLEKSGITQNQQIRDFKMRDVPLREVLTRMVAGANPDKTATSTADPKQSLVWVVDPASTDQAPALLITTRPQADAKGYELPKEFVAQ